MSINPACPAFIPFPDLPDYGYKIISSFLALLHEKYVREVGLGEVGDFEKISDTKAGRPQVSQNKTCFSKTLCPANELCESLQPE